MIRKYIDLTGRKIGKLTVLGLATAPRKARQKFWIVKCDCGSPEKVVTSAFLLRNNTRSLKACGCTRTHGEGRPGRPHYEVFRIWNGIKQRCENPNDAAFDDYGGRGIGLAAEWRDSFPSFLAHVGPRPSSQHTIDRIDNDRGYEPGNVRWATRLEQSRNTRRATPRVCVDLIRHMRRRRSHATDIAWAFGIRVAVVYRLTRDLRMPRHTRWRFWPDGVSR